MPLWLKPIFCLLFLAPWLLGNGECNAFIGSANKNSDEALMYEARQAVDRGEYDAALVVIAKISASGRSSRDGRVLEATAQAGKCGLNFIGLAKEIVDKIATDKLLTILLSNMRSATSYQACAEAEVVMLGIPPAEMTSDDYIFLAFLEFAKMGAVLAANGAADANGQVNGSYDSCTLSDTDAGHIGTGINIAASSIAASGIGVAGDTTTVIQAMCDAIDLIPPGNLSPCGILDPSGFSALQLRALRTIVRTNEIGLDTCGGPVGLACLCP